MSGENYEQVLHRQRQERQVAIGHALRRAAGLPDKQDPFSLNYPDDDRLPNLSLVASRIMVASHGKAPIARTPKGALKNLREIRRKLRYLRAQIAAIDGETRGTINRAGSSLHQAWKATEDPDELVALGQAIQKTPREEWTIPAARIAMERLEDALVPVIEKAIKNSQSELIPATGARPGLAKNEVALIVARYLKDVTGENPKQWPDNAPPDPWKRRDSSEPFAVALTEIFKILGFKRGINAAAKFATSKL